jgi:hypothetical protein
MDKRFILKMIHNSFKQYHRDLDENPLREDEYAQIHQQIMQLKVETNAALHDIVNDVIYEFLTS